MPGNLYKHFNKIFKSFLKIQYQPAFFRTSGDRVSVQKHGRQNYQREMYRVFR